MKRTCNERGIALAVAIFALVVVGGLVSAAFFVAVQEQRVGRNSVKLQQAFAAADGGAQAVVASWDQGAYNDLNNGDSVTISQTWLANNSGWYRGSVKRLNDKLFLVNSEGFSRDSAARQRVGILTRLKTIELLLNSALKSKGNITIGGSSNISGMDANPTGWTGCPALRSPLPAIRVPPLDSARITFNGCANYTCLQGEPQKIQSDATITDSSLGTYGDLSFADLRALATKILPGGLTWTGVGPSLSGTACNTADQKNWGEPGLGGTSSPPLIPACSNYFPVIWVDGSASVNGKRGQGVLIVNGDLSIQGGFEFYGPVIVLGSLNTTGTGGHFNGGVIARNVSLQDTTNTILGDAVINFSSCALTKALNANASGAPLRERGWINPY